MFDAIKHSTN